MDVVESNKTSLKWGKIPKFKDEYLYSTVQVQSFKNDLHIKFTPFNGSVRKPIYMVVKKYDMYSALDIVDCLERRGFNTRHSYDAIMKFYQEKGLHIGSTKRVLRSWDHL